MSERETNKEKIHQALRAMGMTDHQIAEMEQTYRVQMVLTTMLTYGSETGVREFDIATLETALAKKFPDLNEDAYTEVLATGVPLSISNDLVKVEDAKYALTMNGKMTAISILRQQRELEEAILEQDTKDKEK